MCAEGHVAAFQASNYCNSGVPKRRRASPNPNKIMSCINGRKKSMITNVWKQTSSQFSPSFCFTSELLTKPEPYRHGLNTLQNNHEKPSYMINDEPSLSLDVVRARCRFPPIRRLGGSRPRPTSFYTQIKLFRGAPVSVRVRISRED